MDLVPKMLAFLDEQAQLPAEDVSETRLVTSIHWVVDAVNGQLKKWRALNNIMPNVQIPYIGDHVKIVCVILNDFHPARLSNIEDDNVIAHRMLDLVQKSNYSYNKRLKKMAGQEKERYGLCEVTLIFQISHDSHGKSYDI
ncbi:DDE Tnp4 domain-containing protein [Trichonephila clavipes]|nr:DDE Tnp4 domain-containing protein [Trichonephila clavipes]